MSKLYYMGLEPYEGRYTLQLQQWSEAAFKRRGIDYEIIHGDILDDSKSIVTGQVLDAHGRSYYSLTQMANLVEKMKLRFTDLHQQLTQDTSGLVTEAVDKVMASHA